ncbi:hypothetical protein KY361_03705 [Candidatus Woesearchaeota archaeon]|nr:hypothetical protein [Candidatus Woesearchaeota archaeon]
MRKISKEKYLVAALITLGVFFLGLLLGLVIEGRRVSYIEALDREQKLGYESLQLQYAFIDQLSQEKNCDAVSKTFALTVESLESARIRLESFDEDSSLNKYDFDLLKREYVLAQIRFWLLEKKKKELCGTDSVSVLYFFTDSKACPKCDEQSFILTYLKKRFKDKLLIFSFDSKLEGEPMISLLKSTYEIYTYPTLIIDGDKYGGFKTKYELLEIICGYYKRDRPECTGFNSEK